jgi:hypothetical protein
MRRRTGVGTFFSGGVEVDCCGGGYGFSGLGFRLRGVTQSWIFRVLTRRGAPVCLRLAACSFGFCGGGNTEILRCAQDDRFRPCGRGFGFCGFRDTGGLRLCLRMTALFGGGGWLGLGLLEGQFLVAEFAFESLIGDLTGVEDFAGSLVVDGFVGDALGDVAGDADDGVAVGERRDGEAAVGEEDDGRGADAVFGAEVLAEDGGFGAAGVVGDVLEALVEVVWALDVWFGFVHVGTPPPRGMWKSWVKWTRPRGGGAFG